MRSLIIAFLGVVLLALPASAQAEKSAWEEFDGEVQRYAEYITQWQQDEGGATSKEEVNLYWADLLARSLEHEATLYNLPWEECFAEYAKAYVNRQAFVNNYLAGVYLTSIGPAIEPLSQPSAQFFVDTISLFTIAVNNTRANVTCEETPRLDPADFPPPGLDKV